jgi:hypothetical protein
MHHRSGSWPMENRWLVTKMSIEHSRMILRIDTMDRAYYTVGDGDG